MEAVQQMNVRIPAELKREGDRRLSEMGLTPSQAVRRLYEFVVRNPRERVQEVLETPEETEEQARERVRRLGTLAEFEDWRAEMLCRIYESDKPPTPSPEEAKRRTEFFDRDYKELLFEALEERYAERCLP